MSGIEQKDIDELISAMNSNTVENIIGSNNGNGHKTPKKPFEILPDGTKIFRPYIRIEVEKIRGPGYWSGDIYY